MTDSSGSHGQNLVSMFFEQVERRGEAPFLWAKKDGLYHALTWREAAAQASELARGLIGLGVKPGDRVVLVSENRPEWLIADVAIMAAGAITVPAYVTNTVQDHAHVIEDSGACAAIVSTGRLVKTLLPAAIRASNMRTVVTIEPPDIDQAVGVDLVSWRAVLESGAERHENIVDKAMRLKRGDTACIIYTSGTGGAPKGVMLHHGAILHNCAGARAALLEIGLDDEVFLSFLPLSHSYEHTAGQFFPISIGAQIYYAEGAETLGANMLEARPTIMTAVPRLYEMLHHRISRGVEKQGGVKAMLFRKTLELGLARLQGRIGILGRLIDPLLTLLVRAKVRGRFGGRLKALVSGGAPLNPDIGSFFLALGIRILQGYGQTESAPVISVNRPSNIKIDTVGRPLDGVEVRFAGDGEIMVRGELVMQGYWRNAAASAEVLRGGWLHTGDIGHMDAAGRLVITDRKKDIIVNSGGDNIAPQRIEGILSLEPEISQAMVHGDKRPHLVAVLVPDSDWMLEWAKERGKGVRPRDLAADRDFHDALSAVVARVNGHLSSIEKIRRFLVAEQPFTIEGGTLTPTLKIRRHKIRELYGERLEALYG